MEVADKRTKKKQQLKIRGFCCDILAKDIRLFFSGIEYIHDDSEIVCSDDISALTKSDREYSCTHEENIQIGNCLLKAADLRSAESKCFKKIVCILFIIIYTLKVMQQIQIQISFMYLRWERNGHEYSIYYSDI